MTGLLLNPYRFAAPIGGGGGYSAEVLADVPLAYYRLGDPQPSNFGVVSAATASSFFSSEPPANAFDSSSGTYWTTNGTATGWLRAQLQAAATLTSYSIRRRDDISTRNPKDWTFEGSNNGSTWTVLDTRSGVTWPTSGETKSFTFANSTAYLYYRLNITANNGDTYLSVATLNLGETRYVLDSSGNSRNGVLTGGATLQEPGLLVGSADTALRLASSGKMEVPYGSWMNAASFTAEALFKLSSLTAYQPFIHRDDETSNRSFIVRLNNGSRVEALVWTSGGMRTLTASAVPIVTGTVYHVALTYDGVTIRLYVNGVERATTAITGSLTASAAKLTSGGGSYPLQNGVVDELAYYATALPAARIAAHFAAA